jgi:hypothetical protein
MDHTGRPLERCKVRTRCQIGQNAGGVERLRVARHHVVQFRFKWPMAAERQVKTHTQNRYSNPHKASAGPTIYWGNFRQFTD